MESLTWWNLAWAVVVVGAYQHIATGILKRRNGYSPWWGVMQPWAWLLLPLQYFGVMLGGNSFSRTWRTMVDDQANSPARNFDPNLIQPYSLGAALILALVAVGIPATQIMFHDPTNPVSALLEPSASAAAVPNPEPIAPDAVAATLVITVQESPMWICTLSAPIGVPAPWDDMTLWTFERQDVLVPESSIDIPLADRQIYLRVGRVQDVWLHRDGVVLPALGNGPAHILVSDGAQVLLDSDDLRPVPQACGV